KIADLYLFWFFFQTLEHFPEIKTNVIICPDNGILFCWFVRRLNRDFVDLFHHGLADCIGNASPKTEFAYSLLILRLSTWRTPGKETVLVRQFAKAHRMRIPGQNRLSATSKCP